MTAGHFGLAAAIKSPAPRVPLWALMLSTYLLDFVFIILVTVGVESFAPLNPGQPPAYGEVLIQAYYSHSLVGAALIAVIAALLVEAAEPVRPARQATSDRWAAIMTSGRDRTARRPRRNRIRASAAGRARAARPRLTVHPK